MIGDCDRGIFWTSGDGESGHASTPRRTSQGRKRPKNIIAPIEGGMAEEEAGREAAYVHPC